MKLSGRLSGTQFFLSQIIILLLSLAFLFGLYYILNIQFQPVSKPFSKGPVTSIPKTLKLDLDQPDDNTLTFNSQILVSGTTSPSLEVLISTEENDIVIKSKPDGSFSTLLELEEGVNTLTVAVFDPTGDVRSTQRIVYYSKEKI